MFAIFSIDNVADLRTQARFLRFLDEARVMGRVKAPVRLCIGSWTDETGHVWMEPSFLLDVQDYMHVKTHRWVDGQKTVLLVDEAGIASLAQNDLSNPRTLGRFVEHGTAAPSGDWTYFQDVGRYWRVQP